MVALTMNNSIGSAELPKKRVLIADDHPDMAAMLARALLQAEPDIEVLSGENGREALEKLGQLPVDLLITDLLMPEMNGLELIGQLRTREAGGPGFVVLITAYDVGGLEEDLHSLKVDEVILKPFPPGLLVKLAHRALYESSQVNPAFESSTSN